MIAELNQYEHDKYLTTALECMWRVYEIKVTKICLSTHSLSETSDKNRLPITLLLNYDGNGLG